MRSCLRVYLFVGIGAALGVAAIAGQAHRRRCASRAALPRSLVAGVEARPLFGVGQDSIRIDQGGETLGIPARLIVRMVALREKPEDAFDRLLVGPRRHLQHLVVIDRGRRGHGDVEGGNRGLGAGKLSSRSSTGYRPLPPGAARGPRLRGCGALPLGAASLRRSSRRTRISRRCRAATSTRPRR